MALIVGNWKMNGLSAALGQAQAIADSLAKEPAAQSDVVLCPPATLLAAMTANIGTEQLSYGGQTCHAEASGANTGDISAEMLADAGARYVILGHSERRADHGETSSMVREKALAAKRAGLMPIICVGETEAERDAGRAFDVVGEQVTQSLPAGAGVSDVVIAYEPVWAIGTGRVPTEEDVQHMHEHIQKVAEGAFCVLYGGSVKAANAAGIFGTPSVGGVLVGGASLKADDFLGIIRAA